MAPIAECERTYRGGRRGSESDEDFRQGTAGGIGTCRSDAGWMRQRSSTAHAESAPAPTATVIVTVPAPAKTITRTATPLPASTKVPVPAPSEPAPQPQFANAMAVVTQFYQDITDHDYAACVGAGRPRPLSGGVGYDAWVAGIGHHRGPHPVQPGRLGLGPGSRLPARIPD